MVDRDSALRHHLFQVSKAQRIRHIPADTRQDHIERIVQTLEHPCQGWIAVAIVLCVAPLIPRGTRGATGDPPPARTTTALDVPMTTVIARTVPVYLEYVGTTDAIRSVTLQAQVTGYLLKQAVPDGFDVTGSELLYRIDPRSYQAALHQAKAQAEKDAAALESAVLAQAAALAQASAQLPPLQKQLAQTRDQLTAYVGRFPSEEPTETFDLQSLQLPDDLPVSLPSKLVEQRPDIRASEALLHAASAEVGVATASMLPQLTLSAAYGSETANTLFGPGTAIWNLGAGLAQPPFEGGTLLHRRRAAIAAFDEAAAQYRYTVITAFQNVADALRALQSDANAVNAEVAAERAAADSLAASQRQYHVGAISYLALLDAERTYQQAPHQRGPGQGHAVFGYHRTLSGLGWAGGTALTSERTVVKPAFSNDLRISRNVYRPSNR
jgi:multidrug efflux pump subunit AcrA (membrane-fusion protein)